jgi:hypothetical protein
VPDVFDRLGTPVVALDYRQVPEGSFDEWLAAPRRHRYVAGAVDPDDPTSFDRRHTPSSEFDGLVFVREATPTTLDPS